MKRVTTGRLALLLSRSESPEVLFPRLIAEMDGQVRTALEAEALAMNAWNEALTALEDARTQHDRMVQGAQLTLASDEERKVREAIETQLILEADIIRCEAAVECAEEVLADARTTRQNAQHQLLRIRSRKEEILARARIVRTREHLNRKVSGPASSIGHLLEEVAKMEPRIGTRETELVHRSEFAGKATTCSTSVLEGQKDELHLESEIDRRMTELKQTQPTRG